jgi:hypothetical protein
MRKCLSYMNQTDLERRRDFQKIATLDCETPESAFLSVTKILGLTHTDLANFFMQFDLWDYVDKHGCSQEHPGNLLLKTLLTQIECDWGFSHTTWFHMTRCLPTQQFDEGLKTFSGSVDCIWELLYQINPSGLTRIEWNDYRKSIESNMSSKYSQYYDIRTRSKAQEGPYGILVPDLRSGNPVTQQDHYLKEAPEMVSYICEGNQKLLAAFKTATEPCIVKFETTDNELGLLSVALLYAYESQLSEPLFSHFHNADYIGKGIPVPSDQIREVKFHEDT